MTLTDEELDRDWQPNGRRPQSTIARNFQLELEDIFRMDNSISDLDQKLDERKQNLGKTNQELASLEARLREMEERLSRTPGYRPKQDTATSSSTNLSKQETSNSSTLPPPSDDSSNKSRSRPGTARATQQAPSSGNMPPTPGASEGEYYLVTRADLDDHPR